MAKILLTGAGSAQATGVANCLSMDKSEKNEIIGASCDKYDLMLSRFDRKYLLPHSTSKEYEEKLLNCLKIEKPDMIHFQHDRELYSASRFREKIENLGVKMLIPDNETIDTCVHKYKSWKKFKAYGIKVPENIIINDETDLKRAFEELGGKKGTIWLRAMSIGGGGKGSLPVSDYETAYDWINNANGWCDFVAAELLTKETVTWLSLWYKGELIAAQGRKRAGWAHSALAPSGVTGVTRIGITYSNPLVDEIGKKACLAVSECPNGVYGVDMTYDDNGIPNPTEINIGRFFTTVEFFAQGGLNLPVILKDLCLYDKKPDGAPFINPLQDGLLWIRGMDTKPLLTTEENINSEIKEI